jgi:hypothetical protein
VSVVGVADHAGSYYHAAVAEALAKLPQSDIPHLGRLNLNRAKAKNDAQEYLFLAVKHVSWRIRAWVKVLRHTAGDLGAAYKKHGAVHATVRPLDITAIVEGRAYPRHSLSDK